MTDNTLDFLDETLTEQPEVAEEEAQAEPEAQVEPEGTGEPAEPPSAPEEKAVMFRSSLLWTRGKAPGSATGT